MIVLANPVQPHSEGEIVLTSADPADHPDIRMNYFDDPHDMEVMIAVAPPSARRGRELAGAPRDRSAAGPAGLAAKHGHVPGDTPSDALLEDLARHYSSPCTTSTSTCRIGSVVDRAPARARRRRPAGRRRQRHARTS